MCIPLENYDKSHSELFQLLWNFFTELEKNPTLEESANSGANPASDEGAEPSLDKQNEATNSAETDASGLIGFEHFDKNAKVFILVVNVFCIIIFCFNGSFYKLNFFT